MNPNHFQVSWALLGVAFACAGVTDSVAQESRPVFKPLRYDEDYAFLADANRRSEWLDRIKYVPLSRAGYLSFGGEARGRVEAYENEFFSAEPDADNVYFLQRYLLHADYHPTEWLRAFGQLQSSLEDGREGGPRRTDEDIIDVHQFFADARWSMDAERSLTLRAGRQEMSYGSERLVSVREGTNNRRAFDALRVLYRQDSLKADAFFSSPVEVDEGAFDDQHIDDLWFWGGYVTVPLAPVPGLKLDFYYLGLRDPEASFNGHAGREERHTMGARLFGAAGRWDFNHEALYQFGDFGEGNIEAWSVATDHGYTVEQWWGHPRFGLKAAIATGDGSADDASVQTFNPLFPRGNYFTEASLLGPQNFFDLHPSLRVRPLDELSIDIGADFYWRESLDDGIYNPAGGTIYPGNRNFGRFVGTDLSLLVGWQATRHVNVSAAYTHFFAGEFIHQNSGRDVNYGAIWGSYRF